MFRLLNRHLIDGVFEIFDMVTANITLETNLALLDDVKRVMTDSGILVCAGMIDKDGPRFLAAMEHRRRRLSGNFDLALSLRATLLIVFQTDVF